MADFTAAVMRPKDASTARRFTLLLTGTGLQLFHIFIRIEGKIPMKESNAVPMNSKRTQPKIPNHSMTTIDTTRDGRRKIFAASLLVAVLFGLAGSGLSAITQFWAGPGGTTNAP